MLSPAITHDRYSRRAPIELSGALLKSSIGTARRDKEVTSGQWPMVSETQPAQTVRSDDFSMLHSLTIDY
jgi:hypothetical protein